MVGVGGVEARAPDGKLWVVRRRWTTWGPRKKRFEQRMRRSLTHADGRPRHGSGEHGGPSPLDPVVLGVLELPVEALAALAGGVSHVVARRPWRIEVNSSRGHLLEVFRCGWDDSLRLCRDIAVQLRSGTPVEELVLPPERGPWTPVHPEPTELAAQRRGPVS